MFWLRCFRNAVLFIATCTAVFAQDSSKLQAILDRLDVLEKQNAALLQEIESLKETIRDQQTKENAEAEHAKERSDIANQRIADHEQTKISASQRLPISLTGMFLFDADAITGGKNPQFQSRFSDYSEGTPGGGASLRQSIIGFNFHGPEAFGAKIEGSLSMDFYSVNGDDSVFRIRRGDVSFDWTDQSLLVGQEKPLISPYEPTSYARVGVPALAGAGNLWLWTPQIRYIRRLALSPATQISLQGALLSTYENYGAAIIPSGISYSPTRPAGEVRFELSHKLGDNTLFAIGAGAHASESHVLGVSVPSRVVSADFKVAPARWIELTGTILHGCNFAILGGLPSGVDVQGQNVRAIRGSAGWLQLAFPVTSRLTFDLYGGLQSNVARDLSDFQLKGDSVYAGNILYRVAPNVVLGFEGSHQNIDYLYPIKVAENRYDATVAYLF